MDTYKCVDTSYDLVLLGQNILKFKKKEALFIIANVSFSEQGNTSVMEIERYNPDFPSRNNTFPWFVECHLLTAYAFRTFRMVSAVEYPAHAHAPPGVTND